MAYLPQRDPTDVIGRRIVAFFVDTILLSAIYVAALAATKSASYTNAPRHACTILRSQTTKSLSCIEVGSHVYTWEGGRIGAAIGIGVLAAFLNMVVLQGITGASVGKMMVGLRVVNGQGKTCGVGRAIVRWIVGVVDYLCAGLVGLVTVLVTHPHRRVGDMAGGTYVIGTADVGSPIESVGVQTPAYAYSGAGWTPPAPGTQSWGTAPQPDATAQQPWDAPAPPPDPASQSQWGAPPPPAPAPTQPQQAWPPPAQTPPPPPPTPAPSGESWGDNNTGEDEGPKQ